MRRPLLPTFAPCRAPPPSNSSVRFPSRACYRRGPRIPPCAPPSLCIIACDGRANPEGGELAARPGNSKWERPRTSLGALDFSSCAWDLLFLGILFASVSNQGPDRTQRNSSGQRLPAGGFRGAAFVPILVRAHAFLVWFKRARAHVRLLGGRDCVAAGRRQCVAARLSGRELRLLSFVYRRGAGFFQLSVRRHVARGRLHQPVFCPARILARLGSRERAVSREPVPPALGVVPHLFRIRRGEDGQRRSFVAKLHCHGRLLPERPAAHVDRLVRAAFSALVPGLGRSSHSCNRAGAGLDAVSSAPVPYCVLLHRHPV